ncbi:MAG: CYTH domain-containing protein [Cyanobacteria bacterium]|nr:CYTH domain-containing protein [Cyanobacteriota bacterium]MDA0865239.1 CYTH domain-containing protein [Cyanobacteriota bacterium]
MAAEIERKFLISGEATPWRDQGPGLLYRQGYIPTQNQVTVRVRIAGDQGYVTLKGPTVGITRSEFEYPIPKSDAEEMLTSLCTPPWVEKYRYRVEFQGYTWEVDEFLGDNAGLVLAEVELEDAAAVVALPPWIGVEVSHDPRYRNGNLARFPYGTWPAE